MRYVFFFLIIALFTSCEDDVVIKPHAKLRLQYPKPDYRNTNLDCPFVFQQNEKAQVLVNKNCGVKVAYPDMKATVFLTYNDTDKKRVNTQLNEAVRKALNHQIKATNIPQLDYINPDKKTYGTFFEINGNAASHAQFHLTDSTKHFVTAALYFETSPNFDSLLPAIAYVREDMRVMMETMEWRE